MIIREATNRDISEMGRICNLYYTINNNRSPKKNRIGYTEEDITYFSYGNIPILLVLEKNNLLGFIKASYNTQNKRTTVEMLYCHPNITHGPRGQEKWCYELAKAVVVKTQELGGETIRVPLVENKCFHTNNGKQMTDLFDYEGVQRSVIFNDYANMIIVSDTVDNVLEYLNNQLSLV